MAQAVPESAAPSATRYRCARCETPPVHHASKSPSALSGQRSKSKLTFWGMICLEVPCGLPECKTEENRLKPPAVSWSSAPFSGEKTASAGGSSGLGGGQSAFEWLVVDVLAEGAQITVPHGFERRAGVQAIADGLGQSFGIAVA
jgi:hypothetical protein